MGAHHEVLGVAPLVGTPRYGVVLSLMLALLVAPLASSSLVQIPKCCPLHQQLSYDFNTCIDYQSAGVRAENDSSWWASPDVVQQAGGEWQVAAGRRQDCSAAASTLWLQDLGDVAVSPGGRLLVDVDAVADGARLELQLDPRLYCLDRAQIGGGRRVALSCLCGLRPLRCWTSCCPAGWSLSLQGDRDATCERAQHHQYWQPQLSRFLTAAAATANATPWRVATMPQCKEDEHVVALAAGRQYQLLANGGAAVEDGESPELRQLLAHEYCADAEHFLYCKSSGPDPGVAENARRALYLFLLALGSAFLLATVTVHTCFPVLLSRVLARALVAHCCALLVAYVTAAVLHAASHIPQPACTITAFVMQFSYLAAFFWLNVMCIELAIAVSGRGRLQEGNACRERLRFLVYCLFAWGVPAAICAITAAVDLSPSVSTTSLLKPNIGSVSCWFQGEKAMLIYFYGPASCVMTVNLLLFIITVVEIIVNSEKQRKNGETVENNHSFPEDTIKTKKRTHRERVLMFTKLFTLMGLTWVTDILSWSLGGQENYYWIVTDAINILRPVFIFYIFCWKRRILQMLAAHLPCFSEFSTNDTSSITETESSMNVYKVHCNDDSQSPIVQYTALSGKEISHGDNHP